MYVCFTSLGDLRDWLEKWVPSYFHKFESSRSTKVLKFWTIKAIYSNTVQKCTKMHGKKVLLVLLDSSKPCLSSCKSSAQERVENSELDSQDGLRKISGIRKNLSIMIHLNWKHKTNSWRVSSVFALSACCFPSRIFTKTCKSRIATLDHIGSLMFNDIIEHSRSRKPSDMCAKSWRLPSFSVSP